MPEPGSLDEWLEFISSVHPKDMDLGLERVATVAAAMDLIRPAPFVVTVAGTNGKGSTTAAIEALLQAHGLKVGATYSPHLHRFNERIRIDGGEATDEQICAAFAAVSAARGEIQLTYFEYSALAALYLFKTASVDLAVLEIGLGGRLDAFNLVDADIAVVTSIGLDHQDYLGTDLQGIGREKAGIFRSGRPVVLGNVTESVLQAAADLNCPRHQLGDAFTVLRAADSWGYRNEALDLALDGLGYGAFAPDNCALALTATALALPQLAQTFLPDAAASALTNAHLAGRMEMHRHGSTPVLLDVAHNPAAAAFLAAELRSRWPDRQYVAVYGALEDKDVVGVMTAMNDLVLKWLLVSTQGWRGQAAADLASRVDAAIDAETCESMAAALARADSLTTPGNGILAFGSFSAVEQARELLIEPSQLTAQGR